jgi:ComF family protein
MFTKNHCFLCDIAILENNLCDPCFNDLSYLAKKYAKIFKDTEIHIEYNKVQSIFPYEFPINKLVKSAKYNNNFIALNILSDLMSKFIKIDSKKPDLLIPVPLHIKRLRTRGYNQSVFLAKAISKCHNIPININICHKIKHTINQAKICKPEVRKRNIYNAFKLTPNKLNNIKYVVIVDDIITSGATVNEISKEFKRAGVEYIDIWTFARA